MAEVNLAEIKFGGAVGDRQTAKFFGYTVSVIVYIPYSGYFSGDKIFVVFVVEKQTTKYLPTNQLP